MLNLTCIIATFCYFVSIIHFQFLIYLVRQESKAQALLNITSTDPKL